MCMSYTDTPARLEKSGVRDRLPSVLSQGAFVVHAKSQSERWPTLARQALEDGGQRLWTSRGMFVYSYGL